MPAPFMCMISVFYSRCNAWHDDLDGEGGRRSHELTLALFDVLDKKRLWEDYGIVDDIMVRCGPFLSCLCCLKFHA
jgi:hypothetical protein